MELKCTAVLSERTSSNPSPRRHTAVMTSCTLLLSRLSIRSASCAFSGLPRISLPTATTVSAASTTRSWVLGPWSSGEPEATEYTAFPFSRAIRSPNSRGASSANGTSGMSEGRTTKSIPAFLSSSCLRGETDASTIGLQLGKVRVPEGYCQSDACFPRTPQRPPMIFDLEFLTVPSRWDRQCRDNQASLRVAIRKLSLL